MQNNRLNLRFTLIILSLLTMLVIAPGLRAETIENMPVGDVIEVWFNQSAYLNKVENHEPVTISFCGQTESGYCRAPIRPVGTAGKLIKTGISISPDIQGEWRFEGPSSIQFIPGANWQPDTEYTVTLGAGFLPPYIKLKNKSYSFHTHPLHAAISEMRYMQDSNDVMKKLVSMHINFNYPVSQKSLESKLSVHMDNEAAAVPYNVVMNNEKTEANIEIPLAELHEQEKLMRATIAEGLETADGKAHLMIDNTLHADNGKLQETVMIPSIYSYLHLNSIDIQVVKNKDYVPQQLLIFDVNAPVTLTDLTSNIEIYLLPKDKPAKNDSERPKKDYDWYSADEADADVIAKSEKITGEVQIIPDERSNVVSYKLNVPPSRYVLVKVRKGMSAYGGFILGKDYSVIVKVPQMLQEVKIMSDGALLSLSGEKTLSILSLGYKKLTYDIAQISNANINHLVSQTRGDFQNPEFNNYMFNENNIADIIHEDRVLNSTDNKVPVFSSFDFSKYLERSFFSKKQGLFLLTVRGNDAVAEKENSNEGLINRYRHHKRHHRHYGQNASDSGGATDRRLILVTDMGMLVKRNHDKTSDVFVMSFADGSPVSHADVEVLGLNGKPSFQTETDSDGHANLPDLSGFDKDKEPVAYVVKKRQRSYLYAV